MMALCVRSCGSIDRQLRIQFLGGAQDTKAVAIGQPQIRKYDRRIRGLQHGDGFALIAGFDHGVPLRFERMAQHGAEGILVLDEQNGRIGRVARARSHRSQPGGTEARRASSSRSAMAFLVF